MPAGPDFLDINHQVEVLDLLTDLVTHKGRTVVVVLHDLNLACRYADHIVAMKAGRLVAEGRPTDVITEAVVADVFGIASRVVSTLLGHPDDHPDRPASH